MWLVCVHQEADWYAMSLVRWVEQISFTVYLGLSLHLLTYISQQGSTRGTQPAECVCVHIHICIYLSIYKEIDRHRDIYSKELA